MNEITWFIWLSISLLTSILLLKDIEVIVTRYRKRLVIAVMVFIEGWNYDNSFVWREIEKDKNRNPIKIIFILLVSSGIWSNIVLQLMGREIDFGETFSHLELKPETSHVESDGGMEIDKFRKHFQVWIMWWCRARQLKWWLSLCLRSVKWCHMLLALIINQIYGDLIRSTLYCS